MGMLLRRNGRRTVDYNPKVNGQSVMPEPKKRSLTDNKPVKPQTQNNKH